MKSMSVWELRETIERATPWWGPLLMAATVIVAYLILRWWCERPAPTLRDISRRTLDL